MAQTPEEFRQFVLGVVQGNPGAIKIMAGLRQTLPTEYERIVLHLYERGPRGENLYEQFNRCGEDVLVLGRDLLSRASEFETPEDWN